MPVGLIVSQATLPGSTNETPESGRLIVAAITGKGPAAPSVVRSISHYASVYGARTMATAAVFDNLETFFGEGGGEAVISRVFGPGAAGDSIVLKDTTPVTPADAIRLTAKALGGSSGVEAEVSATGLTLSVDGVKRETYPATGVLDLLALLGDSVLVNAVYIGLGEATNAATLTQGVFPLAGGSDDAAEATTADYATAISRAVAESPGAAVSAPGHYPGAAGLATLADAANGHLLLTATARGEGPTASGWAANEPGALSRPNCLGAWPWVRIPDGDRTKLTSPEGYLGAIRARAHERVGPWQVPAGAYSAARYIVGLAEEVPTPSDFELLSRLNPITNDRGRITLGDYRAATSTMDSVTMGSEADLMASLVSMLSDSLIPFNFETVDSNGHLFSKMISACESVLAPLAAAGGLYGRPGTGGGAGDPGYVVTIDASNNPPEQLAQNVVHVSVGVRLSPTARLIDLKIIRVPLNGAL